MNVIGNRFTLRFSFAVTGVPIHLHNLSMRVDTHTYLEWFVRPVAEAVHRPRTRIRLHVFDRSVQHVPQNKTRTVLLALAERHEQDLREPIHVMVELLPPPPSYMSNLYLCDFGGRCRLCRVPSNTICGGCGNNGCCRCGNCGHKCCEDRIGAEAVLFFCAIQGCQPRWASD